MRGLYQGSVVSVGLPLLDVFLNDNGNALASGERLPVCFGTWFWSLGLGLVDWTPDTTGDDKLPEHLKALELIRDKVNIYSGTQVFTDGASSVHIAAPQAIMTGTVTGRGGDYHPSIDSQIADALRVRTRFRSIEVSCDGNPASSWSARSKNAMNPPEISPLALYQRLFVDGFRDPNAAEFVPDRATLLRKSALSVVKEERYKLAKQVGAKDKATLDEFFTALREMEQRLALELEKPEPLAACKVPSAPTGESPGVPIDDVIKSHGLFTDLITHALACGQTRIFNMAIGGDTIKPGDPSTHHIYSHEERIDPALGYQPMTYWFCMQFMDAFRDLVLALDEVKEGDGTLLDRTLVLAFTDHGDARLHLVQNMPIFTAGGANGGMKTGQHVAVDGDATTRVSLTCQKALDLPVTRWGTGSNRVTQPFGEVLA